MALETLPVAKSSPADSPPLEPNPLGEPGTSIVTPENVVETLGRETGARKGASRWAVALVLVVGVAIGGFVWLRPDVESSGCTTGAQFEVRPIRYADGEIVGTESPPRVVIIEGGAAIGFPDQEEYTAMGYERDVNLIPNAEFDRLPRTPRSGSVFRERAADGATGPVFISAGGAVFEVETPSALASIGKDLDDAIEIPRDGLENAARVPVNGTLLRVEGSSTVWRVGGGQRKVIDRVCSGAIVHVLPDDQIILEQIPRAELVQD